jgi:hypothetical protein
MSPSDALLAARHERQSVMEAVVMATDPARCSPQFVLSVVRKPKYRLSPAKAGRFIAVSATIKSE